MASIDFPCARYCGWLYGNGTKMFLWGDNTAILARREGNCRLRKGKGKQFLLNYGCTKNRHPIVIVIMSLSGRGDLIKCWQTQHTHSFNRGRDTNNSCGTINTVDPETYHNYSSHFHHIINYGSLFIIRQKLSSHGLTVYNGWDYRHK